MQEVDYNALLLQLGAESKEQLDTKEAELQVRSFSDLFCQLCCCFSPVSSFVIPLPCVFAAMAPALPAGHVYAAMAHELTAGCVLFT